MINRKYKSINFSVYFSMFLVFIVIIIVGILLSRQLEEYKLQDEPKLNYLREQFTLFFNKDKTWTNYLSSLNSRNIMNETTLHKGDKSYTINKQKVFMCLLDKNGQYYTDNMLIYVLAHEYSHVIADSIGHTDEFNKIFAQLLDELAREEIYDLYQEIIYDYCQY
jgi:hypothetical protein